MTDQGTVSASITAGPITATGNRSPEAGLQITMGHRLFIHIQPDVARQWIEVLESISKESNA
jgi:hypothetical protein